MSGSKSARRMAHLDEKLVLDVGNGVGMREQQCATERHRPLVRPIPSPCGPAPRWPRSAKRWPTSAATRHTAMAAAVA